MNWYLKAYKQYADFSGRARRKECWVFWVCNSIIYILLLLLELFLAGGTNQMPYGVFRTLAILFALIPGLALIVRRLHDVGKSGWMILIILIPFVGFVWITVLSLMDGQPGPNQWGPDPKGRTPQGANNQWMPAQVAIPVAVPVGIPVHAPVAVPMNIPAPSPVAAPIPAAVQAHIPATEVAKDQFILVGTRGPLAGSHFLLSPRPMFIGRDPAVSAIIVPADTKGVSRRHLEIAVKGGSVHIRDSYSSNGTFVDGRKIEPGMWVSVQKGQEISLGGADVAFTTA